MALIFGIIALLLAVAISHALAKARRQLKGWGIPRAMEIAKYQGWVSPYRLTTQAHLTKRDAQFVLREACKEGVLYQAVNGRHYTNPPASGFVDSSGAETITRQEFDDLRNVLSEHMASLRTYLNEQSTLTKQRSEAEAAQTEWVVKWHAQVTAQINALCAITATCALLLGEAGITLDNIIESIEGSLSAIDPKMREDAKSIFDAVVNGL